VCDQFDARPPRSPRFPGFDSTWALESGSARHRALRERAAEATGLLCEDRRVTDVVDGSGTGLAEAVEPRISYVVARLERAIRAAVQERVRPYGLTTLQYTTLSVLGARGQPLSNAQLRT
jgi:hypothetical protein